MLTKQEYQTLLINHEFDDRSDEQHAQIAEYEAADLAMIGKVSELKNDLSDKASHNAREHLTNKLLLAVCEGTTPDPADVAELRRAFDLVENSPIKDAILAG